jgi:hypothetical protein
MTYFILLSIKYISNKFLKVNVSEKMFYDPIIICILKKTRLKNYHNISRNPRYTLKSDSTVPENLQK